ncbi:MAG: RtcB family protein [Thermoanaerobaculaceae bacterium]|jgi:tRNA-splicing ligase RtcB|nr:RtcB family protein [Thermoanaerobaculaceae bacterium]
MKAKEIISLGVPGGPAVKAALAGAANLAATGARSSEVRARIRAVVAHPGQHLGDPHFAALAEALHTQAERRGSFLPRHDSIRYRKWGSDFEATALQQMENACSLPIAVAGALMPDAHQGYGLPIGGVLATDNAVIPYAVGVDIACRMKLSVFDLPPGALDHSGDRLAEAIHQETRFGIGAEFRQRRDHPVMDEDWGFSPVTRRLRDKAWAQLGTSGSGNHFVELGLLVLDRDDLGLAAGSYLALLTHSGSRGTGAEVADHYSRIARSAHPELPHQLQHLAWLGLDTAPGQEYWAAMHLMGRYAAANHALIHQHITRHLGVRVLAGVENHHNFAWRESHSGRDVIVHRKGATPAGEGDVGIIPGSMGTPGFVVRGKGNPESLRSASHGAGRRMSRSAARQQFSWEDIQRVLGAANVRLLSAGLDEAPMAYKDIHTVMAAQDDLVEVVARFEPRLVKMAPSGERPED